MMKQCIGMLRLAWVAVLILIICLVIAFIFPVSGKAMKRLLTRHISSWIPKALGIRLELHGMVPPVQGNVGYLVCSNHVSFVDIFVLNALIPCRFVAKKEIASWPLFGLIAKGVGTIFIDRSKKKEVLEIGSRMAEGLKAGDAVLFFPEGKTGSGLELLPFYANLFSAATISEAPILPVSLRYRLHNTPTTLTSYAGPESMFSIIKKIVTTPGLSVDVTALKPIASTGKDRHTLCLETSASIAASLDMLDATAIKEAERKARLEAQ